MDKNFLWIIGIIGIAVIFNATQDTMYTKEELSEVIGNDLRNLGIVDRNYYLDKRYKQVVDLTVEACIQQEDIVYLRKGEVEKPILFCTLEHITAGIYEAIKKIERQVNGGY